MSDPRYLQLENALTELASVMVAQNLWSEQAPDPQALKSTEPFSVDTLAFEQWLQFVMLPRFQCLIDTRQPLPPNCDIYPMAQQVWQDRYEPVQKGIQQIDIIISKGLEA